MIKDITVVLLLEFVDYMNGLSRRLGMALLLFTLTLSAIPSEVYAATLKEWTIPTIDSYPASIAVWLGLLYFTEAAGNRIGRLDPTTGAFTEWVVPAANSIPGDIAVHDGLVYFTEFLGNKIGRLDPTTGTFTQWVIPTPNSNPASIAVDGGSVYFTEYSGNKIGRLNLTSGVFTEWVIPTANSQPAGVAVHNGLVYFTENKGSKIGRLDPSSGTFKEWVLQTESEPGDIAVDSSLAYFTEYESNKIGRLDPATGALTEWVVPTANSNPAGIAVYNGLVYFTEWTGAQIGRLNPSTGRFMEWNTWANTAGITVDRGLVYFTKTNDNKIGCLSPSPLEDIDILFIKNNVRMIYPSDNPSKPLGRSAASVSDWLASMAVSTKLETLAEGLDTDNSFVDQNTGEPLGAAGSGIVSFGGPTVNVAIYYYEVNKIAPVIYCGVPDAAGPGQPWAQWYHANGTAIQASAIGNDEHNDLFLIEIFKDNEGRYVFFAYGIGWKGTYAAGKFFTRELYPDLAVYSYSWVIVKWFDANGDSFVNNPSDGDTYTIIASSP